MPKQKLPRTCECGGRMKYTSQFGRVFSCCLKCTPVSTLTIPAKPKGKGK